jgi:hypothetical protein
MVGRIVYGEWGLGTEATLSCASAKISGPPYHNLVRSASKILRLLNVPRQILREMFERGSLYWLPGPDSPHVKSLVTSLCLRHRTGPAMRSSISGFSRNSDHESGYLPAMRGSQGPAFEVAFIGYAGRFILSQTVPMRRLPDSLLRVSHFRSECPHGFSHPSRGHARGYRRARTCPQKSFSNPRQGDRQAALADRLAKRLAAAFGRGTGLSGNAFRSSIGALALSTT